MARRINKALLYHLTGCAFSEAIYDFAVDSAVELVKNYCNIPEVPDGLDNTVIRIAADLLRAKQYGEDGGDMSGNVKSITVGDTSTTFGSVSEMTDEAILGIIGKYTQTLNRYRRITFC